MTVIRAIFFDIGDTLLFDDPPLRDRVRQAIDLVELPYDKKGLPRAFRAAEDYALSRYLEGIPADDPDMQLRCAMIILRELGLADVGIDKLAALRHAFLSVSYQRGFHPDAITLVEELKSRGFKVGAISDWEETLPTLLAELELAKHLDSLAVSAIVGVTKPDPRLFREALRQADVPGAESIHVGDYYELDVAGAREAGMEPVLFDWKDRKPDADCVRVTTFKDLKTYLLSLPAP